MSFVRFRVTATNTEVAVNPDEIVSIAPEANTPANDTQLYIDNMLRVVVDLPIDQVAQRLGPDFVRFDAASPTPFAVYVNRKLVTHVSPNPDVPTACFVAGRGRKQAVRGTLDAVLAILAAPRPGA
jgi:hypothetical protein